ncbi:putative MFS-type transporter EfpA [Baekduia alba]|uniref:DHA2 family efflux MFS transporter permease subunit n=1 Tax=Baekduia alba TaxID=2997333 RepID=UPI002340075A|nr:DHA2 family efflux MFS transporter permease subunit [Baekduia alba]WCB95042.1 putative MFS-type transporter EfpA [Baekduia alba]
MSVLAVEHQEQPSQTGSPLEAARDRTVALVILCAGFFMTILDTTIVNVALPSIQRDLGFSQAHLAWVLNAYLIAFGGLLLLAGRLGDLVGRRAVFLTGLWVFIGASALCGLAQSQTMLIAARFVQGAGGALTSAVILGMVVTLFPEPREQAKAIGAYAAVGAVGASAGLVTGGILTQAISWHWIFFVNVPVGIATAVAALRRLPRDAGLGLRAGADLPGALLAVAALMLGVDAIVEAADRGWTSGRTLGVGALAVALAAAFVLRERTARAPLAPLRIFRIRSVAVANTTQILLIAGAFGQQFLVALYLKGVKGFGPIEIGFATLPIALVIGTVALQLSGRVMQRIGVRPTLLVGLALSALSFALLARLPAASTYAVDLLPSFVLMGLGFGLASPALTTLAMRDVAPQDAGLASGLVNTTQQIGAALGLAILATLSTSRTEHLTAAGQATTDALTGGYRLAFAVAAGLVLVAIGVAALPLGGKDPAAPRS